MLGSVADRAEIKCIACDVKDLLTAKKGFYCDRTAQEENGSMIGDHASCLVANVDVVERVRGVKNKRVVLSFI